MIPSSVKYDGGYEFDPKIVFRCRRDVPIPISWIRLSFIVKNTSFDVDWHLKKWIDENLFGNYIINSQFGFDGTKVSIGFEDTNDAVMFRLLDGENAWQTENTVF